MPAARWLPALLVLLGLAAWAQADDTAAARLTFTKTFKGSQPEYTRVSVAEDGEASYQGGSIAEPTDPDSFRLSAATTARLFGLAAALNGFRGVELEYRRPVAHMGWKVLVYEKGGERAEVSYNYTQNAAALELEQWFGRIARGRFLVQQLAYRAQFDRLGVLETLREFEREFNTGQLVDAEQFAPILERLAGDTRLMRPVQTRARQLLGRIRGVPARLQFEHSDPGSGWYTRVVVFEQGSGLYERRRFDQPAREQPLEIPAGAATRLMGLVREANYFRGQPAGGGDGPDGSAGYRLTYDGGSEHQETSFRRPPDAILAEIVHLFQQTVQQEEFRQRLDAALETESVMLQVVLQELEGALQTNALINPGEFVPVLERIANGSGTHPLVREQVARLLARIRAGS